MDRVFITGRRKDALHAAIAEIGEKTAYRQCVGVSTHGQFTLESKQQEETFLLAHDRFATFATTTAP
jgi:hypothetical protein